MGGLGQFQRDLALLKPLLEPTQLEVDDLADLLGEQRLEQHRLVHAVQELGLKMLAQFAHDFRVHVRGERAVRIDAVEHPVRADVRGHDHDGVAEVHRTALAVGQPSVVEELQQGVEHVRMRLFDFVEQDDAVGLAAHGFGQLAAFVVPHIAGRRTDEPRHGMLFHILAHVEAHDVLFAVKERFGQRLAQLRLAHTRGAEENERALRTRGVGQPGPGTQHGVGHGLHGLILPDHALMELVRQMDELVAFGLEQPRDRNAGPAGHDIRHIVGAHFLLEQARRFLAVFGFVETLFQLRQLRILEFGRRLQIAAAGRIINGEARLLDLALEIAHNVDDALLVFPLALELGLRHLKVAEFVLQLLQTLAGRVVGFLAQGLALDFELHDLTVGFVQFRGQRVDFGTDHGGGFVDQVDGLVGKLTVGDIPVGQHHRLHNRGVADAHAVVHLKPLLQAAQDGNGVLHGRLFHQHGLETPFQRRVLFDVLAVLVKGRRADAVQLAASQKRLQQVARVHRAVGLARAHDGVQLVDEQDNLPFGFLHFGQHGLEPFLKFAAVLGARDERAHVQRKNGLVLEPFRDVALDDTVGEALRDGGLAHARLTDEHGIVLRAARQDADDAADFRVTTDHRVELALAGGFDEVAPVLAERLITLFGVGGGHAVRAADSHHRLGELIGGQAGTRRDLAKPCGGGFAQQFGKNMLHADVLVTQTLGEGLGVGDSLGDPLRNRDRAHFRARPAHGRTLLQNRLQRRDQRLGGDADALQNAGDKAVFLIHQSERQMLGVHFLMTVLGGKPLRRGQRFTGFFGKSVDIHNGSPLLRCSAAAAPETK